MNRQSAAGTGEEVILSFHDSLLRRSDVELLRGRGWLNDRLIGFYFEYLEKVQFKEHAAKVCFVSPDVTQFVKLYEGEAELQLFLEPLALHAKDLVLLAVNDNQSSRHAGGTHWSLLAYWRPGNVFECYDSAAGPGNLAPARLCSAKLVHFLRAVAPPRFDVIECSKQENSYDCGVYVMGFAGRVCRVKLLGESPTLLSSVTPDSVTRLRIDAEALIHALRAH